ncbi:MAG: hypothetical protein K8R40_09610 [Anaerolineaceae bacterium]|nr:hypothetical protein [Anaerolineaceae bacterium]
MGEIGRLLRSGIQGCVVGTWVDQVKVPQFGGMVKIVVESDYSIFGLIHDIHVDDDGLVRQLLSAQNVQMEVIEDNRRNRNVPVEISVLYLGYEEGGEFYHLLPPRPPLSLDEIHPCSECEINDFTDQGFGYFRHVLRDTEIPTGELLASHLKDVSRCKSTNWLNEASQELIVQLRDDYPRLMALMGALRDAKLHFEQH